MLSAFPIHAFLTLQAKMPTPVDKAVVVVAAAVAAAPFLAGNMSNYVYKIIQCIKVENISMDG